MLAAVLAIPAAYAEPGDHIRVGEAELIPSVSLGLDWNSNVYRTAGSLGNEPDPTPGANLTVGPKLELGLNGPDAILKTSGSWGIRKFFVPEQTNLDNFSEADVRFSLDLLPNAVVGFKTNDSFKRSITPSETPEAEDSLLRRTRAELGGALAIHPGDALALDVGGFYQFNDYNLPSSAIDADLNRKNTFGPRLNLKWTFFPKTALVSDFELAINRWENNIIDATTDAQGTQADLGAALAMPDSTLWKARAGLVGRFTQRLVLNLVAGYGGGIYDADSVTSDPAASETVDDSGTTYGDELDTSAFDVNVTGLDGLLIATGIEWVPRPAHTMTLGYTKDFSDSWFTNYIAYHYAYARYKTLVASRVGLYLEGGYRNEGYVGEVTRTDHFLKAKTGASYNATGWMDAGLDFGWTRRVNADGNAAIDFDNFAITGALTFSY